MVIYPIMESQSDFICFYGSFLSEELGINNGNNNEINYANVEIVFTLMCQFSQRRKCNIVWCASTYRARAWVWTCVLHGPTVKICFLRAWPCQYQFGNDQHRHSMVEDLGDTPGDLNKEMEFSMGAKYIHFNIIHFLDRSPTKGTCGRQGLQGCRHPELGPAISAQLNKALCGTGALCQIFSYLPVFQIQWGHIPGELTGAPKEIGEHQGSPQLSTPYCPWGGHSSSPPLSPRHSHLTCPQDP